MSDRHSVAARSAGISPGFRERRTPGNRPDPVTELALIAQRRAGNQAVARWIQRHAASHASVQRLKVANKPVDIASLTTREAEEYSEYLSGKKPTPRDVVFEAGDDVRLREALGIMGRLRALQRQIDGAVAQVVVEDTAAAHTRKAQTRPSETTVTIPTKPHAHAPAKQQGPYNLWSGTEASVGAPYFSYGRDVTKTGEHQALHSGGFIMGQTSHHFRAESILEAAEGKAHGYEQDPKFHYEFAAWLEQPIEDRDLAAAGLGPARAQFEVAPGGALKARTWLLQDPKGKTWVEDELKKRKQAAAPEAGKSSALEQAVGAGPPDKDFDTFSKGTSNVANESQWGKPLTGDEIALVGLHDANFHSAWDPTSEQTAVDAVRSFTPVASYGIPGHFSPASTVQHKVEIPTIQKEAQLQKGEMQRLVVLLAGFDKDPDVKTAIALVQQGIDQYVEGAQKLTIDMSLPTGWPISQQRLDEDKVRKESAALMTAGGKAIKDALALLTQSKSAKTGFT